MGIDLLDLATGGALFALFGAAAAFMAVFFIAIYVYSAFAFMAIAKKNHEGPLWFAWVPFLNLVLLLKIAKIDWQWIFALFVGIIPVIGGALIMAGFVYVWWKIVKHMHKPEWYAILMIVPIVNLVVMGYLAWGKH